MDRVRDCGIHALRSCLVVGTRSRARPRFAIPNLCLLLADRASTFLLAFPIKAPWLHSSRSARGSGLAGGLSPPATRRTNTAVEVDVNSPRTDSLRPDRTGGSD